MIIYSKKIARFINEITQVLKKVLADEIGLRTYGERFYDKSGHTSYPLKVVIYNHKSMLGYFDCQFYELGFHENLMHVQKKVLHDVIRHELAHYLAFIAYGEGVASHGVEFRKICQELGWGEEVFKATICIEEENASPLLDNAVLRKVKKLLALSSSNNIHEAELAMLKSQQLLIDHNIESQYLSEEHEEKSVLKRVLHQRKPDAKLGAIAKILSTFMVNVIYRKGNQITCLEILGDSVNVEIADYVAKFLSKELDILWNQTKFSMNLKGLTAKNSFYLGVAKGYCNKVQQLKRDHNPETLKALLVIENKLTEITNLVYKRLGTSKSRISYCEKSAALGQLAGNNLQINPAINSKNQTILIN